MPTPCNDIRNEFSLAHSGTAQSERQPWALQSDYVLVDERTYAQWIVFVRDYARFVQYHNLSNTPDGNWEAFWQANPAIVLANLAAAPLDDFRKAGQEIFIELQKLDYQDNSGPSNIHLQEHFNLLFDLLTTLAWQLDRHIQLLPDDLPSKDALRSRISQALRPALGQWIAWQKHAQTAVPALLLNQQTTLSAALLNLRVLGATPVPTEDFYTAPPASLLFSDDWLPAGETDWATYLAGIVPAATIFGTDPSVPAATSFAIRHYFFTSVYEQFLQAFALAATEAEKALQGLLTNWNQHEPHFALFLAFLRLLSQEQAYLNTLTDRHLRFYFERVLRLQPRPAQPHQAFLTVELAKHVATQLLPAGTLFKAGKDGLGKDILFASHADFVANKAQVTELRSIFKAPDNTTLYQFGDSERPVYKNADRNRYYAATVSNSADGLGEEELTTADGRWHPFGNRSVDADTNTWQMDLPPATIGFAVASHYLYLTQGTRIIDLQFNGSNLAPLQNVKFRVSLTTEKGWLERIVTVVRNGDSTYHLRFTIDADEVAILPYQVKVHGGAYQTAFPIIKAELIHEAGQLFAYQALKNTTLSSLDLDVDVTGKHDVSWGSSTGPLDVSKPFHPFGPSPGTGAVFVMGDKEIFQKKATIDLNLTWKDLNDGTGYYTGTVSGVAATTRYDVLDTGNWVGNTSKNILPNFSSTVVNVAGIVLGDNNLIAPDFLGNTPYTSQSRGGYLRFRLNGDWGHARYPLALAAYAKGNGTSPALPDPLYDPQLLDVSINYSASQHIPLSSAATGVEPPAVFYHLHPFGLAARHGGTQNISLLPLLVPQSVINTPDGTINNVGKDGGEWLLGVEGLVLPQVLSLLVQVAPGTADPLLQKPVPHVSWWYLSHNEWLPFASREVSDTTNGLLQTGLIQLSVPAAATTDNTLLPAGKIWLRASVESAVDGVSQLIGVHAQAFAVTQIANDNDPALGAVPLPAGTIAKLRNPLNGIKKVVQPYATFGGSALETADKFYTRTSERLRHKDRAITQWDYERMLLQAFPQLHKVKCLNHLRYEPGDPQPIYRELAAGNVTIISVTATQQDKALDPLRPYTSLADLQNMQAFLAARTTCFAKLHLRNPIFEPVLVTFKVRLYDGLDESFYETQLNQDLIGFLSPWAFNNQVEIDFGGKINKSAIVNFIEERAYVNYIEDLVLSHTTDPSQQDVESVSPTKQVSILVSARQHDITIIQDSATTEWLEDCGCATNPDGKQLIGNVTYIRAS
ncbi:MAG: hypothetical protein DA408_06845 [Bacteroidetes bacterium]|nr:MAG: hypothetical protein C7N36_12365 [Bacteroidota bacterium]PTM13422.1 MAG: hypothetical protein DA408_06845 [Bacteroidota bacterium]